MTPTSTSIAPGARAGTAVPSRLPAVGRAGTDLLERPEDRAYRRLAEAPIGEYGVLEAAVAWHRLRPAEAQPVQPAPTLLHLPIVETPSEAVAARVARLLSGLTWAIVTRVGDADAGPTRDPAAPPSPTRDPAAPPRGSQPAVLRVAVPKIHYHRVLRALTGAWRTAKRQCRPGESGRLADGAAVALWRMGLLTQLVTPPPRPAQLVTPPPRPVQLVTPPPCPATGSGRRHDVIFLPSGTAAEAGMFAFAARRLGLVPALEYLDGAPVVALCDPDDVRRLFDLAGAGPGEDNRGYRSGPNRGAANRGRLPTPDRVHSSARRH